MAVDVQEVAAPPSTPVQEVATPSPGASPSTPESSRSGNALGWIAKRFGGGSQADSPSETVERSPAAAPTSDASVATPQAEERPAPASPRHTFQTDEDLRRYRQSISDQAIEDYKKKSETEQRKQVVERYQNRIKEARSMNDLALAGELAGELQDYQDGISSEITSEESIKTAQERAAREAQAQTAGTLDIAYTTAFWEALPEAMQGQYVEWWNKNLQPDAQGRIAHSPEEARSLIVKQFLKLHAEYYRELGHNDVLDDIEHKPEVKKAVIAALKAPMSEPPTGRGQAQNGSPQYRTVADIAKAVTAEELTPAEGLALKRRLEGRRR